MSFDHSEIEKRWRKKWTEAGVYQTKNDPKKKKYYVLDMFPYPSGAGLHVGHLEGYTATDIVARYKRLKGFEVLHPMGWDAFGLPAENSAIKEKVHPAGLVARNVARFKSQLQAVGFSYDWSREINTTDPDYYRWTQWIFLQMFKEGLAYEAEVPINWCLSCKTGLANEEVVEGKCERCGSEVTRKDLRQWMLAITKYADRLLTDLEDLDWAEPIKEMQRNWIGRSEGAEVDFEVIGQKEKLTVFTTRPDTLFGATYMVLAPEHELVAKITTKAQQREVETYVAEAERKSDLERTDLAKDKTGVFTGGYARNPANQEKIPIWAADYVLRSYGTGAIMAVPAHDQRDHEFARKFDLSIVEVIKPKSGQGGGENEAYPGEGTLINSGRFDGMESGEARAAITKFVGGKKTVNYKLRDWVFSRQRYWGEPIPVVHCDKCGVVPVAEKDLPIRLPEVESYEPTGTGESPLAGIEDWARTKCPACGGEGRRETNTMPQWAGSCWYYLRFIDPENFQALADPDLMSRWLPVDFYIGGAEHAVLHLLYARFWHKFLHDLGVVPTKEPFQKLVNQGMILAEDGRKMSKSLGNVINPDEVVAEFGADTVRLYEMFMGPLEDTKPWDTQGISGLRRFLEKVWRMGQKDRMKADDQALALSLEKTIKKVGEDIESLRFNTAISAMMIWINEAGSSSMGVSDSMWKKFLLLLSPFAPFIVEELWHQAGGKGFACQQNWPEYDPKLVAAEKTEMVFMINGKVRAKKEMEKGLSEDEVKKLGLAMDNIQKYIEGKKIQQIIFVPDKLMNFVL